LPTDLPTDTPTDTPTDDGGQDQGSQDQDGQDDSGDTIQVTYEVTGDGPATILYLEKLGSSPTRVESATLPWKFSVTVSKPAVLSVVAMRTDTSEGHVTCHTLVDGQEVKENTSGDSAFATAACSYVAFD
jgi:hypothetical protein